MNVFILWNVPIIPNTYIHFLTHLDEAAALQNWNAMDEDYLAEDNCYHVDRNDAAIAITNYSKWVLKRLDLILDAFPMRLLTPFPNIHLYSGSC